MDEICSECQTINFKDENRGMKISILAVIKQKLSLIHRKIIKTTPNRQEESKSKSQIRIVEIFRRGVRICSTT